MVRGIPDRRYGRVQSRGDALRNRKPFAKAGDEDTIPESEGDRQKGRSGPAYKAPGEGVRLVLI